MKICGIKHSVKEIENDWIPYLSSWMGLVFTKEDLKKILEDYRDQVTATKLSKELEECGMDTLCRETFMDIFAQHLTNLSWPLNRDDEEYAEMFWERYKSALGKFLQENPKVKLKA